MSTSDEFHLFPALPPELRLKIWGYALSVPRNVTVLCLEGRFERGAPREVKFSSPDRPPALLHVCRESRCEALRIYTPAFQTGKGATPIYVAFSQDTIESSQNLLRCLGKLELEGIQRLVLVIKDPSYFADFNSQFLKMMQHNLRELELLIDQGDEYRGPRTRDMFEWLPKDIRWSVAQDNDWTKPPNITVIDMKDGRAEMLSGADFQPPPSMPFQNNFTPNTIQ